MKKLCLLGFATGFACLLHAQPSFQTSLEAGISLPLNATKLNGTYTGEAIHFGNHLDYSFGEGAVKIGLGAYIGYLNALSANNGYAQTALAIAEKYHFSPSALSYTSSAFKSTQVLLGPVLSVGSGRYNLNVWAKGGYGLNEPSRYAVIDRENGAVNNVYINQAGDNKNGLAYRAGAGFRCAVSDYTGLLVSASYFSTRTDQVNYNFDREKGIAPLYYSSGNSFIQASAAVQFTIGNPKKKTRRELTGMLLADTAVPATRYVKKAKRNEKNKPQALENPGNNENDNTQLFFLPERVEVRSNSTATGFGNTTLQPVNNYITGFAYQTQQGNILSQCGAAEMPGEPIPGIDVKLKSMEVAGSTLTATTNRDGSFSFNNVHPGNYLAEIGNDQRQVTIAGNNNTHYRILDVDGGSCGTGMQHYLIASGDKMYVEVVATHRLSDSNTDKHTSATPRDVASGMATGRRMHKPFLVPDMAFDLNTDDVISEDGKLYAAVINAREAGSGMATGRSILVTGDLDGDGIPENTHAVRRDAGSGMATGKRMHKPLIITIEEEDDREEVPTRDAGSGMATGKRMHKPMVIRADAETGEYETVKPRDAASGLPAGRRMATANSISLGENEPVAELADNPLYESPGSVTDNPLYENNNLTVVSSNGKTHQLMLQANLTLRNAGTITAGNTYPVAPVNQIIPTTNGKGIQEKGVRRSIAPDAGTSDASQKTVAIKDIHRINCNGGVCAIEATMQLNGALQDVVIYGTFKTKHDTVKNSVSNIR